jgi:hypothetical protein
MIIDIPDVLREVVKESGARPTHPGAEDILDGPIAREVDRVAAEYGEIADRKWKTVCLTCARSLEPAGGRGPTSH